MSVYAEWKSHNLILLCRWFSFWGKNVKFGEILAQQLGKFVCLGFREDSRYLINKAKNHCNVTVGTTIQTESFFCSYQLFPMYCQLVLSRVTINHLPLYSLNITVYQRTLDIVISEACVCLQGSHIRPVFLDFFSRIL